MFALNDKNDPYYKRREAHAERYYEELRRSNTETIVKKLSEHSGVSLKSARKVFEHVFIKSEYLSKISVPLKTSVTLE